MATIINDKDKILQASAVRLLPTPGSGIVFSNPAPIFKVTTGTVAPLSYAIEAKLTGLLQGTVTWSVLSGTINSTAGQNGNTWTIAYSNLLTDSATVQASLTFLGSTYTNTFTISKIADARSVDLTMTSQAFVYNVDGLVPVPSTSSVTATAQNNLGTAYYEFIVGTTTVQNTTSNTYTYTPPASFSSMPQQITVKLRENSNNSTVLATDVVSMLANKTVVNGTDAVYIDLVSESDVTTADNDGTGYTLPTGNSVRLYRGNARITTGVVYGPATTTKNGLTATVNASTGAITLSGSNWSSDTESFDFTATYNSQVYTANYTIAKSKTGSSAVFIDLLQEADIIPSSSTGTAYTLPTGNSIRLYQGGVQLTTGVVYGPATTVQNGLTATVNTTTGAITLSGTSWSTDREIFTVTATFDSVVYSTQYSITKAKAGVDAVTIDLLSESDVTTAANNGTGYTLPTGNSISLYNGSNKLTTGVLYGPATTVQNGLTATVNTSTGAVTLSGAAWTSDTESFDFTATFNSLTYTANYTIAKSKTGSSAVFIDLLQEADVIASSSAGTAYTLPTGNSIRLYQGGAQLTTGVVYGPASTVKSGLTLAVNTTTGAITLSGASWSSDREVFTVTATFNSVVYSTQYSLTKAKQGLQGDSIQGDTGPRNAQVYYYNPAPSSTAPAVPTAAQLSYNFSTGAAGSTNVNWSASFNPNALTTTSANNKYWAVRVTFQEDFFDGTYTKTVSAAFTWQNLNGLVTFTNLANGQGSGGTTTTFIDGGSITANSLSVSKITSGSTGVSVVNINGQTVTGSFALGSGERTPLGNTAAIGSFTCSTNTGWALAGFNTNSAGGEWGNGVLAGTRSPGGAGLGAYSVSYQSTTQTNIKYAAVWGETGAGGYVIGTKTTSYNLASSPTYNNLSQQYWRVYSALGMPNYGYRSETFGNVANIGTNLGVVVVELGYVSDDQTEAFAGLFVRRHISGGNKGDEACRVVIAPAYNPVRAIEVSGGGAYTGTVGHFPGGITTFTGVHESQSHVELTVGDILVDVAILEKQDIANVFSEVEPSTVVNDTRVIGVVAYNQENKPIPLVPDDNSQSVPQQGFTPSNVEISKELEPWKLRYTILVNALGEGQINVCGENGNITAGDLIVTSSMRGKGMRQSDDLIRSYTVAKARESVVFDSPSQVKMIACIYLCG